MPLIFSSLDRIEAISSAMELKHLEAIKNVHGIMEDHLS